MHVDLLNYIQMPYRITLVLFHTITPGTNVLQNTFIFSIFENRNSYIYNDSIMLCMYFIFHKFVSN